MVEQTIRTNQQLQQRRLLNISNESKTKTAKLYN
jgi:hypothetical protein